MPIEIWVSAMFGDDEPHEQPKTANEEAGRKAVRQIMQT